MSESQDIEYKQSWRDEYLKWICGFANAQGGKLYIGVDDNGNGIGVKNLKKLLEDIPNMIRNHLGIKADVNKHIIDGKDCIEICVTPSSFPVNYHGDYYFRSGSTNQQLVGPVLSEFISKKTGLKWEDVTVDGITVDDLDPMSFKIFRREALNSKRMTREDLNVSNEELLRNLHLIKDGKLTRAAVLLFYDDPGIVQEGSYLKIGKFGEDLEYQDIIEGSIINIADKAIDVLFLKYLKAKITYEHDRRVETYPYSRDALREAIFNALAHNCYMFGVPIQVRVEEDAIIISNSCILPDGWTVETLMQSHESIPYNPKIAGVFYRAGYIETWGRGVKKIIDACAELGSDTPVYSILGHGLRIRFPALQLAEVKRQGEALNEALNDALNKTILEALMMDPGLKQKALAEVVGVSRSTIQRVMLDLQNKGILIRKGGKKKGYWEIVSN